MEADAIAANGNGLHTKSVVLGMGVIPGTPFQFFSPDGTRTILRAGDMLWEADRVTAETAYAVSAYAYAALKYRAQKVSEPPLMVVKRDKDGNEEWVPSHPLEEILDDPSPDYDMAQLLKRTQLYLDLTGQVLWVKDDDAAGRPGRLTPYCASEFSVEQTRSRIYGRFRVETADGGQWLQPERVVFFQEMNPADWHQGQGIVDVMLRTLNLGHSTMLAVRAMLRNAVWPSVVVTADKDWNPDPVAWEQYKALLDSYALPQNKGKPMALTGGGRAQVIQLSIGNLIPTELLDRVESVVASVSGVPAVVLQSLVGLKNSPWSQMSEAHRQCAVDTIRPLWTEYENRLTRQLLWVPKRDRMMRVKFDTSDVPALQRDRKSDSEIMKAAKEARICSRNELRLMIGLEPSDDAADDELPEFEPAPPPALAAGAGPDGEGEGGDGADEEDEAPEKPTVEKMRAALQEQHKLAEQAEREVRWKVWDSGVQGQELGWLLMASGQLDEDRATMLRLTRETLEATKADEPKPTPESVRRLIEKIQRVDLAKAWRKKAQPMVRATAQHAVAGVATEIGVSFSVLQPGIAPYVQTHAAELVTGISDTTKQALKDLLEQALTESSSMAEITQGIADAGVFMPSRAQLIARTETTAVSNGASRAALEDFQARTDAVVEKSWLSARDARVREEHAALDDGEWIPVDDEFDNGLTEPSEPNCRCTLLYRVRED